MANTTNIGIPPYIQGNSSGDNFSLNSFDPETGTEMQALNRKQQIANLLVQQSLTPRQGQMVGNVYVPAGWGQGLAQIGQAIAGAYMTRQNDKARAHLESQNQQNVANALASYQEIQQGRPALTVPDGSQGPERPEMPATPEGQRMGLVRLMANQNPAVQRFAQYEAQRQAREAEAKAAREAEANKPQHVDLGGEIGIIRNGQLVGRLPKTLAPQKPDAPIVVPPGGTLVRPGEENFTAPKEEPVQHVDAGDQINIMRGGKVIGTITKGVAPTGPDKPVVVPAGGTLVRPGGETFTAPKDEGVQHVDAGDNILVMKGGQIIQTIPKGLAPQAPKGPIVMSPGQVAIDPSTQQQVAAAPDKDQPVTHVDAGDSIHVMRGGQIIQTIPKGLSPQAPDKPVVMSPGQVLIGADGKPTASVPAAAPHPVAVGQGQALFDPQTGKQIAAVPPAERPPVAVSPGQSLLGQQGGQARVLYQAPSVKEPDPVTRTETILDKSGKPQVVGITQSGKVKPIGQAAPKPHDGENKPPSGYRQTADGNLEAIPGGPADVKAHVAQSKLDAGRQTVNDLVMGLRDHYDQLDKLGGITNPDKGVMSNLSAGAGSSGMGQAVGRMFGTQTQSLRNTIAQQRPLLLNAIKEATGMSAKQMDSNAEMKMYLAAATDPTLDVKANRAALDMLDKLYGLGGQAPAQPAQATTPQSPAVGTVKGGYRFKGGDPASPSSWEKQ